ncbi:MAG: WYL domain-containing transcriptional regulator [Clostridia bacterium]|nr:WYL domain-containing transcriptional regulator [Clostridia bacterium]
MKTTPPRILCVLKILERYSDEAHPISVSELIHRLQADYDIDAHRATLYNDIELLNQFGIDIICTRSTQNRYFIGNRTFEIPQIRLLIDAITSSKCLTVKKSDELIDKLLTLVSEPQAALLRAHPSASAIVKPKNERIYYIIDVINRAIEQQRVIRFAYTAYAPTLEQVLRGDGEIYTLSPYACIWNGDYYYCIGWSDKRQSVTVFRVDRIAGIPEIGEEPAAPPPSDFDLATYTKGVFQMYVGEPTTVTLLCDNAVLNSVIDKFSENIETEIHDDDHVIVKTSVSLSPPFFAWVFEFGGRIRILGPDPAIDAFKALIEQAQKTL